MTKTLIAKPVVKNQFWIVTNGKEKVGNVLADGSGFEVKYMVIKAITKTLQPSNVRQILNLKLYKK